jgi:hypothetical protein
MLQADIAVANPTETVSNKSTVGRVFRTANRCPLRLKTLQRID